MNKTENNEESMAPSRNSLKKGAFWTFVGAAVVTVLFVMPAEYGVDPTGIGEKIGLTRLAAATAPDLDVAPRVVQGTYPAASPDDEFDYFEPETLGEPYSRPQDRPFRSETIEIALAEYEQVEVKAVMNQGDAIVYSWQLVDGETVYTDFHADPHEVENFPERYYIRYQESEEASASGSLVAPFTGNHGWYWLNPVKIELEVRGYYDSLEEIMRSFQ